MAPAQHPSPLPRRSAGDGDGRGGSLAQAFAGLHVAIIMDGNGRWATARGRPRVAGHRAGADAVDRVVRAAPDLGIGTLTLFAFSSDNWQRPAAEVDALMKLFRGYLRQETAQCLANGVRLNVIGRRDRLSHALLAAIDAAEAETALGRTLHLRIAVDYSARDALLRAAGRLGATPAISRQAFARTLADVCHASPRSSDVDLLIRTGGEQRLSDFLLWECAYAEILFLRRMWPDFDATDLASAVKEFHARERRYGGVPESTSRAAG